MASGPDGSRPCQRGQALPPDLSTDFVDKSDKQAKKEKPDHARVTPRDFNLDRHLPSSSSNHAEHNLEGKCL